MILDARSLQQDALISADVCIAGAGAAGITLARELLDSGLRVVVLESGGFQQETATQNLYLGSVDTQGFAVEYNVWNSRLRFYGGTTNHWSGWCRPLDDDDFEVRSRVPRSGWPISGADLAPYYDRARAIMQFGSTDFDVERIASTVGKPVLPLDPARAETIVYLLEPTRFGPLYRDVLTGAGNLTVYLNANLVNIRLASGGSAIESFECATLSGVRFRVAASRYVLALGGIENARILLASNSQEPAGVGNRNDLVGRCFMEHLHSADLWTAIVVASTDIDLSFYTTLWTVGNVEVVPGIRLSRALRAEEGLAGMSLTLADEGSVERSLVTSRLSERQVASLLRSAGPVRLLTATIRGEQRPETENRITLRSERDELGVRRVNLRLHISQRDLADLSRNMELLAFELGRIGLGRVWMPTDAGGQLDAALDGASHHMGSTRMAASPTDGVVDAQCRVHGVSNLYVAGCSVFTTGGYANPTLTIVALAIRLADHLRALS